MTAKPKLTVTFYGAVRSVTGSNFLVSGPSKRILIDCGMFQGGTFCEEANHEPFPYDPSEIEMLVVTHAHIDHIGRIPKLCHDGFHGKIYSTAATKDLAEYMLEDSLSVFEKEGKKTGAKPLFSKADIAQALSQWEGIPYHKETTFDVGCTFILRDAGHILGSAMVDISCGDGHLLFTGDLGNSPSPLMHDAETIHTAKYLVIDSVYGDRLHADAPERREILEDIIEETVARGGALLIPAFSLERTQILLYEINKLLEGGRIPKVPVFVDSPLAMRVTEVYRKHKDELNEEVQEAERRGDDVFAFPKLTFTEGVNESHAIARTPNPKIIIAGGGMSHGGRIIEHEKLYLPDPKSTLLIVGYQAAGSVGRQLQEGAKKVRLHGEEVTVRARVKTIGGYSGHRDSKGLLDFVEGNADTLRRVFAVAGEEKSSSFLVQRIRDYLGVDALAPEPGKAYELEF